MVAVVLGRGSRSSICLGGRWVSPIAASLLSRDVHHSFDVNGRFALTFVS